MKNIKAALVCEFLKFKRSAIFRVTVGLFIFIPCMFGLMLYISQHPDLMAKMGVVGTKAKLFGENDWKGFFGLLNQGISTIGLIGFGFVTTWVFGSEYAHRTLKDILALPVSRSSIVISKFIVTAIWCFLLASLFLLTALIIGKILCIPGWETDNIPSLIVKFIKTSLLTIVLTPPVGFIAGYARGIVAPLGFVIITLILAQFMGLSGLGGYFPWSVPGVFAVTGTIPGMKLTMASYIIIILTGLTGILATIYWWKHADHH